MVPSPGAWGKDYQHSGASNGDALFGSAFFSPPKLVSRLARVQGVYGGNLASARGDVALRLSPAALVDSSGAVVVRPGIVCRRLSPSDE